MGVCCMRYVGVDPLVGLNCRSCDYTTVYAFSRLLNLSLLRRSFVCRNCGRVTDHGRSSLEKARALVSECMHARTSAASSPAAESLGLPRERDPAYPD